MTGNKNSLTGAEPVSFGLKQWRMEHGRNWRGHKANLLDGYGNAGAD